MRFRLDDEDDRRSAAARAYLAALVAVGEAHGFSLGHEDGQGGFIVHARDESNDEWLLSASQADDC